MIHIERFEVNMFQENCYIASDETGECIVIDCGAFYEEERKAIVDYINGNNLKITHLICTHGHIDHNFGDYTIFKNFGVKPEIHKDDKLLIENLAEQAQAFLGLKYTDPTPEVEKFFDSSYTVQFGTHSLSILHTPGHTPGSVMFYCKEEKILFSGDTLFRMSIGRTDFKFGSYKSITESLRMVANTVPPETTVLPGHGEQTTIAFEQQHNPYIK